MDYYPGGMPSRESTPSRATLRRMRSRLLDWYDVHQRELPWRQTRDPYAIWLSETMLQQTRVDTVIPYWERFLQSFPTVDQLAKAETDEVYALWQGLGYYSRARNLMKAARQIVSEHGGSLPADPEALRGLAGIGRYTAGAVASIAFQLEEPLVDGNVIRVLSRRFGIEEPITDRQILESFWTISADLVQGSRPGDLNQAVMELGATVCTPRSPHCGECPLGRACVARRVGNAEALPNKPKKTRARAVGAVAAWITRKDRVLAVRRPEGGLLGGLWELPGVHLEPGETPRAALKRGLPQQFGLRASACQPVGEVEHLFTHRRLRLHVYRCPDPSGRVRLDGFEDHRWVRGSAVAELPHGGPTRKALSLLGVAPDQGHRARVRRESESVST